MKNPLARLRGPSGLLAGASLVTRIAVMINLVAAAQLMSWSDFVLVAYAMAVASAMQILIDPNSFNFMIANWHAWTPERRRGSVTTGLRLQAGALLAGVLLTVAIVALADASTRAIGIAAALSTLAGCESMARFARVTWQFDHRFGRYAGVDLAFSIGRIFTLGAMIASPNLTAYSVACVVACIVPLAVVPFAVRALGPVPGEPYPIGRLVRDVWPYGASTTLSSVYAQAPGVLIGIFGNVSSAAVYAVAVRISQSTELVPAAIANARLPRLARAAGSERLRIFRAQRNTAAAASLIIGGVLVATSPLLLSLFRISWSEGGPVLIVLAVVLLPKFMNYQLVALAMVEHQIVQRLRAAAVVAVICVGLVIAAAPHGTVAVAMASLASETILLALLLRASGLLRRRRLVDVTA